VIFEEASNKLGEYPRYAKRTCGYKSFKRLERENKSQFNSASASSKE
jgi:hypothetical protein